MKKEYKFMRFEQQVNNNIKTKIWFCFNIKHGALLGIVKWFFPWRQYCFIPEKDTVFSSNCCVDIIDFISIIKKERRNGK